MASPDERSAGSGCGRGGRPCGSDRDRGQDGHLFPDWHDLKAIVAPALEVRDSKGSWANVEELSQTKGVSLAIVQSDVYTAFVYLRDSRQVPWETRQQYATLLSNLRVFMPLYREEIHFLMRRDSPLEFIHQIRGKRIMDGCRKRRDLPERAEHLQQDVQ